MIAWPEKAIATASANNLFFEADMDVECQNRTKCHLLCIPHSPHPMAAILTATELVVRYNEQVVLNGASLTIDERDRIGLVGRNGSGKSTFLKILAGVQTPDKGEVTQRRGLSIGYL